MVSAVSSTSKDVKIYSVLDQRRHDGPVFFDDATADIQSSLREGPTLHPGVKSLYHGGVGYTSDSEGARLEMQLGEKTGDWSTVGTSTQPVVVDMFTAWLQHSNISGPGSYTTYPGVDYLTFLLKNRRSSIKMVQNDVNISAVLDQTHSKAMIFFWSSSGDPSQTLTSVTVTVGKKQVAVQLPTADSLEAL